MSLLSRVPVGTPVLVLNRDPLLKLSPEEATDEFGEDPEMY